MEFFLQKQVTAVDPRLEQVYRNFDGNLSAIIEMGQNAGSKVILGTVAVNLRDCPPFKSLHRVGLGAPELRAWEDLVAKGQAEEAKGADATALSFYVKAAEIDPEYAELIFRRGTCELRLGQLEPARTDFDRARDLDTLRFRADSALNRVVQKAAATRRVELVDCAREAESSAPNHIPGEELFYDHVHFNFHGNYLMATSLAARVEKMLFPGEGSATGVLSEAEVAHQLAFTDFDKSRVGQEMRMRLQQPPFSSQSNFKERDADWSKTLTASKPDPNGAISEYRAALSSFPDDWVLRANFGRLLESAGDKAGAKEQWTRFVQQMDQEADGYYALGNLAYDAGAYEEATELFRQTLHRRPGSSEALNALGLSLAARQQVPEAQRQYEAALKSNPRFSAARVNLASLLASQGQVGQAIDQYEMVLRVDTNNAAAAINLAKVFVGQGKTNEAIALYTRALETRPDNAIAHFDLGNALTGEGRHAEALAQYEAAVQYQPEFIDAHYNLALELAQTGRLPEAIPHLETVIRLNPKFTEGHFNYAVALAKLQRYPEAVREFEETLKLDPNRASARALLDKALALSSRAPRQP
jgi:tetratricopeptide (TPR) repeat protein